MRRSPLAAVHERLGATRWVSDQASWPACYQSEAKELAAVRYGSGLQDWGPVEKLMAVGAGVLDAAAEVGFEATPGKVLAGEIGGRDVQFWGLTPERMLVTWRAITGDGAGGAEAERQVRDRERVAAGVKAALGERAHVSDLSSGLAALRLVGPNVRGVLEEVCPLDLSVAAFPDGAVAQGPLAKVQAIIGRQDLGTLPRFTILVPRDLAQYTWDALMATSRQHGLEPVGSDVMAMVE